MHKEKTHLQPKHQFQNLPQKRQVFDRKVQRPGYTATVSMGKIIPKDWTYVRIQITDQTQDKLTITISKLMGRVDNALGTKTHPQRRPDA